MLLGYYNINLIIQLYNILLWYFYLNMYKMWLFCSYDYVLIFHDNIHIYFYDIRKICHTVSFVSDMRKLGIDFLINAHSLLSTVHNCSLKEFSYFRLKVLSSHSTKIKNKNRTNFWAILLWFHVWAEWSIWHNDTTFVFITFIPYHFIY